MPDETNPQTPAAAPPAEGAPAPAETPTPSERAEGAAVDLPALQRELQLVKASLKKSQTHSRETTQHLTNEHKQLLHTTAKFDNYQKRAVKDKDDVKKFGVEALLKNFLPMANNLKH